MLRRAPILLPLAGLLALSATSGVMAQEADIGGLVRDLASRFGDTEPGSDEGASLSGRLIQLFALITVLSIAPGLLVMATSFTRFVIVFSLLRSALGLNQTPPNIVLNAMALFMTLFVMQPVFDDAWEGGLQPLLENTITEEQAVSRIGEPFRNFMLANVREKDLALFREMAGDDDPDVLPEDTSEIGWRELIPAFMISELRRAFTIGFLLYLPFIAIDLIVASVLMSAGMIMLPPVIVSLPFKIIFFVLIDGWYMLAGSLMESYAVFTPL
ncbi:flagellar type III secretion system pore protein FliP [Aestuariivita sp.]|jgi:flagellar biosynthetic protein FliP|uniref:flagellar type III secretion system pore protein FliP n=1 Tax=Aestuariivita sp. TaxID=1872407 RepID=UPI0021749A3F|nr:flagellar type III secretion system pore protein FliP [Aestuariivita sp.]MCE8008968.1 flagellar type III secretion system pore protein FliP [Aestuariivita sp.]